MGLVSICGKIVNFREHETGSSKSEAAKVLLKMLIKDHTSIIEARLSYNRI